MVNIGIIGAQDCGKTSVFVYFMNQITQFGEKIILVDLKNTLLKQLTLSDLLLRGSFMCYMELVVINDQ